MLNQEKLLKMRHSAEHVLTMAMGNLGYEFHMAMGPATNEGFYFDFELLEGEISEKDFKKIEKEMRSIINKDLPITKASISTDQAKKLFKGNPYKQEWIKEIEEKREEATVYWIGEPNKENSFVDLCKGPHVSSTKKIGAIKLLSIAGAYWRGNEKNKMLTRIYGTAFETKEEILEYLKLKKEAEKNNHRELGKQLELFTIIPEIGAGLPVWLPNGYTIRRVLEDYMYKMEKRNGYKHILTPHINKEILFKTSGHLEFYKGGMYAPLEIDDETYYLKPMNCPAGMMVYKQKPVSYKQLPIKLGEFGTVYRYEKSGELHGLQRVRGFTQNDAHIFCEPKQLEVEIKEVLKLMKQFYKDLGFNNYKFVLALSDPKKAKYNFCGARKDWDWAEETLRKVMKESGIEFKEEIGEAAFYGPKIDVLAVNVYGKTDAISTVQIDFNLPEKFDLNYINEEGNKERPFVIHRALVGSFERFFAFLIEYYKGAFPTWLSPVQVQIIPISEKQNDYAKKIKNKLLDSDIRVEIDDRNETMGNKIRKAQEQKIPFMIIIGEKEMEANTISVRTRDGKQHNGITLEGFTKSLINNIISKSLNLEV